MRWGCLAVLLVGVANAQTLMDPGRLAPAFRSFDAQPDERKLDCGVRPIKPALDFGFRFQSGWILGVPMKQYSGSRHRWSVVTRIVPEEGQPVYLGSTLRLPPVTPATARLEVSGSYLLGEGRYSVQFKLVDESGRVCRSQWKVEARRGRGEDKVRLSMPAATVSDLSRRPRQQADRDDTTPFRLTVLLHAAPVANRRIQRMTGRDRVTMMGILSSLLDRVPSSSVRMVVFNLDHQTEMLRLNEAGPNPLGRVGQALNELELGTVDFQTLANRKGHVDLLADLINKELAEPEQSDAVVFLGPPARFFDKVPGEAVERSKASAAGPGFFYFQYRSPFRRDVVFGDSISSAVSRVGGKFKVIRTPGDFAKAIAELERRAEQSVTARIR
jgi:hypothetical protein